MQRFINNWASALTGALSANSTVASIDPSAAARLAGLGAGDYYLLTIIGMDSSGKETQWEVVRATAQADGAVTIERGEEDTTAREWPIGALVEARYTAGAANAAAQGLAAHEQSADPHPQYATPAEVAAASASVGDALFTLRAPGSEYVAQGSVHLQSAYPALFDLVGLIGGTPGGLTWTDIVERDFETDSSYEMQSYAAGPNGTVIATFNSSYARSTDNGQTWEITPQSGDMTSLDCVATDGSGTWVITKSGGSINYSTDDGLTWTYVSGIMGATAVKEAIHLGGSTWLLAGDKKVFRSTSGPSGPYTSVGTGIGIWFAGATDGAGNILLIGGGIGVGNMFRSADNGQTWAAVTNPFESSAFFAGIATDRDGLWLAFSIAGRIATSTDAGTTWTVSTTSGLSGYMINPAYLGGDVWVAHNTDGVLYRSADNGAGWTEVTATFDPIPLVTTYPPLGPFVIKYTGVINGTAFVYGRRSDYDDQSWGAMFMSAASYPYDDATQFAVPSIPAPAGLTTYIKAL